MYFCTLCIISWALNAPQQAKKIFNAELKGLEVLEMITRQHTALAFMAYATKGAHEEFRKVIPWILLPDGIRAFIGPRQAGHHEISLNEGEESSWMIYPDEATLKSLTRENAAEKIAYKVADGYKKCVIGEMSDIKLFDAKNYGHKHYHALRIHMVQDDVLDKTLRRELVYCGNRFIDRFVARHKEGIVLDGQELRKQVALFEELGFIHLVGKVYERTGILMDGKWFEENVLAPLMEVFPEDLAQNTFKYMAFSEELDARIKEKRFLLTEEEKASVIITEDLEKTLDQMYSRAYRFTCAEI